jgi:hypothetical protein
MTDCGWLSDRMPIVAGGQAGWTPDELLHLNRCRTCQQEWELVQVAHRLGDSFVASFDSPAVASSVIQRLVRERELGRLRRRAWSFAGVAAAAALTLTVWTSGMDTEIPRAPASGSVAAGPLAIPLPELDGLQPAELGTVLQMMDESNTNGVPVDEPSLGDLNSDELERVLDSWEG